MKIFTHIKHKKGFTLIELLVVIAIIGILSAVVLSFLGGSRSQSRDAKRVSEIRQISYALELYYNTNLKYPTCLYSGGSCITTLQGTPFMKNVPKDPLTNLNYSYAANGSGVNCTTYHLGASLENKNNSKILQTGSDAAPASTCDGSLADFSGLSYAAGGQMCNAILGIAQPNTDPIGESCYDLKPQ